MPQGDAGAATLGGDEAARLDASVPSSVIHQIRITGRDARGGMLGQGLGEVLRGRDQPVETVPPKIRSPVAGGCRGAAGSLRQRLAHPRRLKIDRSENSNGIDRKSPRGRWPRCGAFCGVRNGVACGWDVSRCGDRSWPLSLGQDFVGGLSVLLRGTVQEKLNWAFNLYDINKDGFITKEVPRGTRRGVAGVVAPTGTSRGGQS